MKKIFVITAVCCLAVIGIAFSSCGSYISISYRFICEAENDETEAYQTFMAADGFTTIWEGMKVDADQAAPNYVIFKSDSRAKAIERAKASFAKGIDKVKGSASYKGLIINLIMLDPDNNEKPVKVDSATL